MGNSEETVAVLRTQQQTASSEPESLDYAFSKLRGALTRMNLYGDKAQRLQRQLENSAKTLEGTAAAPPHRAATWNQTARLEDRLESRLLRMERLLSQRLEPRRVADVGVQAGEAGRPKPSCCCRRRGRGGPRQPPPCDPPVWWSAACSSPGGPAVPPQWSSILASSRYKSVTNWFRSFDTRRFGHAATPPPVRESREVSLTNYLTSANLQEFTVL